MDKSKNDFDENYFLGYYDKDVSKAKKHFILVIYDISDNKKRNHLVKILNEYGFRVQKSAFEALIEPNKYKNLIKRIKDIPDSSDSIRVYKIQGKGAVEIYGTKFYIEQEEAIII